MAIGNVGTYATVEGTPVDFGKMIAGNIDKYQEGQALQEKLKQERSAAKAKGISDEMGRLKEMKSYTSSGKHEYDDPVLSTLSQFKDGLYDLQQRVSTGEISSLYANQYAEKANQSIEIMNNGAKYIQEKSKWLQDNHDKLNTEFLDPDALSNFLKKTKSQVQPNGEVMFSYEDKDGKISSSNINEIVDKVYDIPRAVNLTENLTKFQASHKQDEIARIKGGMIVTPTEKNQHLKDSIATEAGAWISNRDTKAALWSQYESKLPEKDRVGPKKDNFSEEQTKKLYDYAVKTIDDSYNKEVKMTKLPSTGGGGDGSGTSGKSVFVPTTYPATNSFEGFGKHANGQGITVSDASDKKNQVILSTIPIGKGGSGGKISNGLVTDVMYDDNGKMIGNITYVDFKSTKLTKEQQALGASLMSKGYDLDDVAEELGVSSATLAESRKTLVQTLGESAKAKVLSKLGMSDGQLKSTLGYDPNKLKTSKSSTNKTKQVGPKVGTVSNGYTFTGGNPNDKNNWKQNK